MDYEGNPITNETDVKDLEARVTTLETEYTALSVTVNDLQSQVGAQGQSFSWCDPTGTGALFYQITSPPYLDSDVITGCTFVNTLFFGTQEIKMGGASGPNTIMAFQWDFYGTILQPYASPIVTMKCFVGVGSLSGAYSNPVSDDTYRGVPQIVAETPCHIRIFIQIQFIAPDQFGVFSQTERTFDTPNIPTQITQASSTRGWTSEMDFRPYIRFNTAASPGFQFKLLGMQMKRTV